MLFHINSHIASNNGYNDASSTIYYNSHLNFKYINCLYIPIILIKLKQNPSTLTCCNAILIYNQYVCVEKDLRIFIILLYTGLQALQRFVSNLIVQALIEVTQFFMSLVSTMSAIFVFYGNIRTPNLYKRHLYYINTLLLYKPIFYILLL